MLQKKEENEQLKKDFPQRNYFLTTANLQEKKILIRKKENSNYQEILLRFYNESKKLGMCSKNNLAFSSLFYPWVVEKVLFWGQNFEI